MCNRKNITSLAKKKSSKYRGVSFHASNRTWRARIKIAGRSRHLGYWPSEALAGEAYDRAAIQLLGDKANLNFPESYSREEKDRIKVEMSDREIVKPKLEVKEVKQENEQSQLWKVLLPAEVEGEEVKRPSVKNELDCVLNPENVMMSTFPYAVKKEPEVSSPPMPPSSSSWEFDLDGIFDDLTDDSGENESTGASSASKYDSPRSSFDDGFYTNPDVNSEEFVLDDELLGALTAL